MSPMTPLETRPAVLEDLPPLAALLEDYRGFYFDDYALYDHDFLKQLIHTNELIMIDYQGYPVGVVWFSDKVADLHVSVHLLLRPEYLRKALKQDLFSALIHEAFYSLGVSKIKALALETQRMAIKLLRKYKFKHNAIFRNETRQHGKKIDVFAFELHRHYWEKQKS